MATTEAIAEKTTADTANITCSGPTLIALSGKLSSADEVVTLKGEDAAGNYTDEIYRFLVGGKKSVLIEEYRVVQVAKTATLNSVGIGYGS